VQLGPLLRYLADRQGSDLHLKVPSPPVVRLHGALTQVPGAPGLRPGDTERFADEILGEDEARRRELAEQGETDLAYTLPGVGRFRVSVFRQRGSVSIAMRLVAGEPPSLEELNLPPAVATLAEEERGIILVTGTTGSGKSTTLASIIDRINRRSHKHVVSIEDPIEILHRDRLSIINQREVGQDTPSFAEALRRVLRQDPDVIMIGEIRDLATMETALAAAETGHLVLSTLHTLDASETVHRIIDFFPLHQHKQVRSILAGVLRGIVSQRLVPRADGRGRVPAVEVMVTTGRARDFIVDEEKTDRLHQVIAEGEYYGMQTFDQSLFGFVTEGAITLEQAMKAASSPHDFKLMLDSGAARRHIPDPGAVQAA
jgi:twitching motility protein PilT